MKNSNFIDPLFSALVLGERRSKIVGATDVLDVRLPEQRLGARRIVDELGGCSLPDLVGCFMRNGFLARYKA